MKRFFCSMVLPLFTVASPVSAASLGQTFLVTHFSRIRVDAPIRVIVTTGKGTTARAEGDRETLDRIQLTVSGEVLTVRMGAPSSSGSRPALSAVTLRLTTDRLEQVVVNGAGAVEADRLRGATGVVSIGGSGTIDVGLVSVDRLLVSVLGNGAATMAGGVLTGVIDVMGAGRLNAGGLEVGTLKLSADGPGSITVGARTAADLRVSGAATVTVTGRAACKVDHVGTGMVTCSDKGY